MRPFPLQDNIRTRLANTSGGRVGWGGNASFHTYQLDHHDRWTDRQMDGRTDKASYKVACPQLKIFAQNSSQAWTKNAQS